MATHVYLYSLQTGISVAERGSSTAVIQASAVREKTDVKTATY